MSLEFDFSKSDLNSNMTKMMPKLDTLIGMYSSTKANDLLCYMQTNRPWVDRTGLAKSTLRTAVSRPKKFVYRITLAYGVDYGIWLELAHEKNFAIIGPTIRIKGAEIENDLQDIINKLKF